jgi:hypothetical protein
MLPAGMAISPTALACVLAFAAPAAKAEAKPDPQVAAESESKPAAKERKFLVGLEAVGLQVPALRSPVVGIDPRFSGETVAMGGLGAFGRWRPVPLVGIDLGIRSGSVRYRNTRGETESVVSQDLLMPEAGFELFVARGDVGHLELDAGGGGMFNSIRYELGPDSERSTQTFGSGFIRAGVGAELLTKRIAFVFTLRVYGVLTDTERVKNTGPAFIGLPDSAKQAAVPALQTFVVGALGIAYRF